MNKNELIPNILNDVFNERKVSIINTFQSIFEKILHENKSQGDFKSFQGIDEYISGTMVKLFSSEQERFLSYLIYYISHLANICQLKDPNFASQFYIKKKEFDEKYDNNGQLRKILQTFRSHPLKSKFPDSISYFALFLGFSFDATMIRSTLFEIRKIFDNFMKTVFETLKISKHKISQIIQNSSTKNSELERKTSLVQIEHEKEHKSYQTKLQNYQMQIEELKQNQTEMEQFRLNLEGDLIQIINLIESLEKEESINSKSRFIDEIKNKSNQLLSKIKLTIKSKPIIESNNHLIQQLNEKDIIIKELKNQLQNTMKFSDENKNYSLPLINKTNSIDGASRMSEVLRKSSIDLQDALNEKQELRKKLLFFQNLQMKYDSIEKERNELKEKLEEANFLKEKYHQKCKLLKQKINDNDIKFNSLIQRVSKLQKKVDQQKNRLNVAEKPLTESDFKNFKGSLLIEQINEQAFSLVEYENFLAQLQRKNLELLNENESYRISKKIDKKKINQLKENIEDLSKQLDERDEQYSYLRSSLTNSNISQIEEQLQISLNENENLIIKFNKLIKKYQDLKNISQSIANDNIQLNQQIDSLKNQIKEYSKSEEKQNETIQNETNIIEKAAVSNDNNSIIKTIDDSESNHSKNDTEVKEKPDNLSSTETKIEQLQETISKLQEENQQISKYYNDIFSNIRSFLPYQNEQELPQLIKQLYADSGKLKSVLNLTKSENIQILIQKITNLVNEYYALIEIKKITKTNNNQDAQNKITALLKDNDILNKIKSKFNQVSNENILEKILILIHDSVVFQEIKFKLTNNTDINLSERINALLQDSSELDGIKTKFLSLKSKEENENKNMNAIIDGIIENNRELNEIKIKLKQYLNSNQNLSETIDELLENTKQLQSIKQQQEITSSIKHENSFENQEEEEEVGEIKQIKTLLNIQSTSSIINIIQKLVCISNEMKEIENKLQAKRTNNKNTIKIIDEILEENKEFESIKLKLSNENTSLSIDQLLEKSKELEKIKSKLNVQSSENILQILKDLIRDRVQFDQLKTKLLQDSRESISKRLSNLIQDSNKLKEVKAYLLQNTNEDFSTRIKSLVNDSNELKELKIKFLKNSNESFSKRVETLINESIELREIKFKILQDLNENLLEKISNLLKESNELKHIKARIMKGSNEGLDSRITNLLKDSNELKNAKSKLIRNQNENLSERIFQLLQESQDFKEFKSRLLHNTNDNLSQRIDDLLGQSIEMKYAKLKVFQDSNSKENLSVKIDQLIRESNELTEVKTKLLQNLNENLFQAIDNLLKNNHEFNKITFILKQNSNLNDSYQIINDFIQNKKELNEIKSKLNQYLISNNILTQKIDFLLQIDQEFKEVKSKLIQNPDEDLHKRIDYLLNDSTNYNKIMSILRQNSNFQDPFQIVDDLIQNKNELNEIKIILLRFSNPEESFIQKINNLLKTDQEFKEIKSKLIQDSSEALSTRVDNLLKDNYDFNKLLSQLTKISNLQDPFQIVDQLIQNNNELSEAKLKLVRLSDASFLQIIDKLINSNNQLNEINSKLIEFSNSKENTEQKINHLLKSYNELKEIKAKLHDSSQSTSQKVDQLLKDSFEINRLLTQLRQNSILKPIEKSQIIDFFIQNDNELNKVKLILGQFSNSKENILQKIEKLLYYSAELNDIESKLNKFSNSNQSRIQKINQLLRNNDILTKIESKLIQFSNKSNNKSKSNKFSTSKLSIIQKIDDLLLNNIELNKIKSLLNHSPSDSNENLLQKINILLQNNNELKEINLKLHQNSDSAFNEKLNRLSESNKNLVQRIDKLLIENKELKETQSKTNDEVSQRIDNLIENERAINHLKKSIDFNSPDEIIKNFERMNELAEIFKCKNHDQLPKTCSKTIKILNQISSIMNSDIDDLPENILLLKEKVEEMNITFIKLNDSIPFNNNKELLQKVKENMSIISEIHKLIPFNNYKQLIYSLKSLISFENEVRQILNVDDKRDAIQYLKEIVKKVKNNIKESFQNSDLQTQTFSQKMNEFENNHLVFLNELASKLKIDKNKISENKILQKIYILQELADLIHSAIPEEKNPINALRIILDELLNNDSIFNEIHEIIKFDKNNNLPLIIKEKEKQIEILREVAHQLSLNSFEDIPKAINSLLIKA